MESLSVADDELDYFDHVDDLDELFKDVKRYYVVYCGREVGIFSNWYAELLVKLNVLLHLLQGYSQ